MDLSDTKGGGASVLCRKTNSSFHNISLMQTVYTQVWTFLLNEIYTIIAPESGILWRTCLVNHVSYLVYVLSFLHIQTEWNFHFSKLTQSISFERAYWIV